MPHIQLVRTQQRRRRGRGANGGALAHMRCRSHSIALGSLPHTPHHTHTHTERDNHALAHTHNIECARTAATVYLRARAHTEIRVRCAGHAAIAACRSRRGATRSLADIWSSRSRRSSSWHSSMVRVRAASGADCSPTRTRAARTSIEVRSRRGHQKTQEMVVRRRPDRARHCCFARLEHRNLSVLGGPEDGR